MYRSHTSWLDARRRTALRSATSANVTSRSPAPPRCSSPARPIRVCQNRRFGGGSLPRRHGGQVSMRPPTLLDCLWERASRRRRSRERTFCAAAGVRPGSPRTGALPDLFLQRACKHPMPGSGESEVRTAAATVDLLLCWCATSALAVWTGARRHDAVAAAGGPTEQRVRRRDSARSAARATPSHA
jgi:hypothetical protein